MLRTSPLPLLHDAVARLRKAICYEEAGQVQEALKCYDATQDALIIAKVYVSEERQKLLEVFVSECKLRSFELRTKLVHGEISRPEARTRKISKSSLAKEHNEDEDPVLINLKPEKYPMTWSDIVGLEEAKKILREAVILPNLYPKLFLQSNISPWSKILLYGPPGTGKTYLARAVASELPQASFFSVTSSHILSHWMGRSEKTVAELFKRAAQMRGGCVLFLDEIDGLCRARSQSEDDTTRRVKNELLRQLDAIQYQIGSEHNVYVIAATNLPWELDPAVLRRFSNKQAMRTCLKVASFQKKIYVPLPDDPSRARLFLKLAGKGTELTPAEAEELAERTRMFSVQDIANAVNDALMEPLRELEAATHWKRVSLPQPHVEEDTEKPPTVRSVLVPASASDSEAFPARLSELPAGDTHLRLANAMDLRRCLDRARPSIGEEDLRPYEEWTTKFGERG